jgi:hypothetical protein
MQAVGVFLLVELGALCLNLSRKLSHPGLELTNFDRDLIR